MSYIDENGQWKKFSSSPVRDAYWKICECELCISDRTELIARGAAEQLIKHQDEMIRDMIMSSCVPAQAEDPISNHQSHKIAKGEIPI
jgi:hypothetical protein